MREFDILLLAVSGETATTRYDYRSLDSKQREWRAAEAAGKVAITTKAHEVTRQTSPFDFLPKAQKDWLQEPQQQARLQQLFSSQQQAGFGNALLGNPLNYMGGLLGNLAPRSG